VHSFRKLNKKSATFADEDAHEFLDAAIYERGSNVFAANWRLQGYSHDLERCVIYLQNFVLCIYPGEFHQRQEEIFCSAVLVPFWEFVLCEV